MQRLHVFVQTELEKADGESRRQVDNESLARSLSNDETMPPSHNFFVSPQSSQSDASVATTDAVAGQLSYLPDGTDSHPLSRYRLKPRTDYWNA
jgi:hypothetical protein